MKKSHRIGQYYSTAELNYIMAEQGTLNVLLCIVSQKNTGAILFSTAPHLHLSLVLVINA